ncbi:MAG: TonB-dependent receptor [Sediminibacterium magnilacihabitans]|jgi:outer membrane receptor for ferrienterochelin and colicins|nr:TonB-dependent receptor [Sediminibacterium magnilacihabitans]PQV56839.1 iron complex outermembrane receptor protein [Sediminibacterium magnilacihabitans]
MRHTLLLCMLLMASTGIYAQHTIRLQIKKDEEKQLLAGATATIPSLKKSVVSDSAGIAVFTNITAGSYKLTISYVGLEEVSITVVVPQPTANLTEILLKEAEANEQEVIVTATRTSRTISDIPTRVETISGEELEEKGNMKPGDIRMLLNESTGIQTQQTSATSYNSSIRIQGLDGRYTQILRDGFPLYSGFSGGLSLMQVAPLDLKQIEVIKGSSSTLYGGGAIAGLVNLVSKTPTAKRELSFLGNATSAGGIDLSGFYSQRFKKTGITVFGSGNTSKAYDPAGIGLTAIPQSERYTIQPRLFFYGDRTTANIGFGYITENRTGGSMDYIEKGAPGYFEKNHTDRFSTQAELTHKLSNKEQLIIKYSYTRFNRLIQIPGYAFSGLQQSSFSEATYNRSGEKTQWIAGANFLTDDFKEKGNDPLRNYDYHTLGAFIQNTWTPIKKLSFETGLRGDYVKQFGFEWLPRIAVLFKISPALTARLGGGMGYKNPTLFTEEAERMQFQHILPMNENTTVNERSSGGSLDVNYRTKIGNAGISFNQLFFYTWLNKPLVLTATGANSYQFINANGHIDTKGTETNVRITYGDFKLFLGYTYAYVNTHFDHVKSWYPLTSRHRLNNVLMYEKEGRFKIGAEAYYYSPQKLNDGAIGKPYWTVGLMGERSWRRFAVFLNLENITDTRQTRFDTIYQGTLANPSFRDIYAPVEGFVANGGVRIRL